MSGAEKRLRADPLERRLIYRHGLPAPLARAYADMQRGAPD